jgi:dihydrofolate reductase
MRKLIMWNMVTLDGFFEGPKPWDIDWHEYAWGEELERLSIEQTGSADMLLFGRVTYEGMAGYWPSATGATADIMNSIPKVVFSRTLTKAGWNNTRLVKDDAAVEVTRLKGQSGRDLFVFGSAALSSSLMQHGLIDEYRLGITPIVLGSGSPLFKPSPQRLRMKLLEARPLKTGCLIVRYEPEREAR